MCVHWENLWNFANVKYYLSLNIMYIYVYPLLTWIKGHFLISFSIVVQTPALITMINWPYIINNMFDRNDGSHLLILWDFNFPVTTWNTSTGDLHISYNCLNWMLENYFLLVVRCNTRYVSNQESNVLISWFLMFRIQYMTFVNQVLMVEVAILCYIWIS